MEKMNSEEYLNASADIAQMSSMSPAYADGFAAASFMATIFIMLGVILVGYAYLAVCLMKIAQKTNTPNGWLAWIPIANIFLMLQIAGRSMWWIILFFIPIVSLVISIIIWMDICEKTGKERWLGILMIVPLANIILPGYLAFSKSNKNNNSN